MTNSLQMHYQILRLFFQAFGFLGALLVYSINTAPAQETLPWQKDFATAREVALREGKPIFLMMTATWCGPCKMLEKDTLTSEIVRASLQDFVWVQAFEDKEIESKYTCNGYPTLVFLDPANDKVFSRTVGSQKVGPFLKNVIAARKAGTMSLSPELEKLSETIFVPNYMQINKYIEASDAKGLKEYLQPASKDILRESNFALIKLKIPDSIHPDDVLIIGTGGEHQLPKSGLLCVRSPVSEPSLILKVIAHGCRAEEIAIEFTQGEAVATKSMAIKSLSTKDGVRLSGQVFRPDGRPAVEAIVRVLDLDWVKTDKRGRYQFTALPPGDFTIRAEYPGAEIQDMIRLVPGKPMKQDITLSPAATIGIRWTLQRDEGSTKLTGNRIVTGEAYFSLAHSRFSLERGAEVRIAYGSDFKFESNLDTYSKNMTTEQVVTISKLPAPQIFFWQFDGGSHGNGLHLEEKDYDEIEEAIDADPNSFRQHYKFLQGDPVRVGQVYTVFCCQKKRYAKLEIVDLSLPFDGTRSSTKPKKK